MNRLLMLEDNLEFSRNLLNYIISKNKKIQLWNIAISVEEVEEKLEELEQDDILLLDLDLSKSHELEIINQLIATKKHIPYIIIISEDPDMQEKLRDYLPYIYMATQKPFAYTRMVETLERITYQSEEQQYEYLVKDELRKFEINITTIGYGYIVDAITACLQDETLLKDMKNGLYKSVSIKNHDISISNIKWTVEKCIKSTIRYTSSDIIKPYFHIEAREKITPKFFIATIVENLQQKIDLQNIKSKEEIYS